MDVEIYKDVIGKTIKEIKNHVGDHIGADELTLVFECGSTMRMYHVQECCETVYLYDVVGDLDRLVGSPLLQAESVSTSEDSIPETDTGDDSHTWTYYKFATVIDSVSLRWIGTSNGYYSELVEVDITLADENVTEEENNLVFNQFIDRPIN